MVPLLKPPSPEEMTGDLGSPMGPDPECPGLETPNIFENTPAANDVVTTNRVLSNESQLTRADHVVPITPITPLTNLTASLSTRSFPVKSQSDSLGPSRGIARSDFFRSGH